MTIQCFSQDDGSPVVTKEMLKPDSFFVGKSIKICKYETLDGIIVDSTYFSKNKISFITSFTLGCLPCMHEVEYLNKLQDYYKDKPVGFVSYTISSKDAVIAFNADKGTPSKVTATLYMYYRAIPPIKYPIISINYKQLKEFLQVNYLANPTHLIVDSKGVILYCHQGFPILAAEKEKTYLKLKNTIDLLLSN